MLVSNVIENATNFSIASNNWQGPLLMNQSHNSSSIFLKKIFLNKLKKNSKFLNHSMEKFVFKNFI